MINLGISYTGLHDSSCALFIDNEITFAVSEERLTRVKQDSNFPVNSINAALEFSGIKAGQIDNVIISWSPPYKQLFFDLKLQLKYGTSIKSITYLLFSRFRDIWINGGFKRFKQYFGDSNFLFCPHHLSHALSTFCYSGLDEAAVLVVDGRGAFESTSIWHGKNGSLEPLEIINYPNSLGLLYAKFTKYLGFQPLGDEWKVMGLAPFGNDSVNIKHFITQDDIYRINEKALNPLRLEDVSGIEKILGPRRTDNELSQRYKDIAFSVQKETEIAMVNLAKHAMNKSNSKNLCLSGGVALNCKANGMIADIKDLEELYIQPASSDDGASIGAALYPFIRNKEKLPKIYMKHPYLGNEYSNNEILNTINSYKLRYRKLKNKYAETAKLLSQGSLIGLFQGRMEFGPRALGNRSIIADPRYEENKDRVNNSVKYREMWRPFAPSILKENYFDFFDTKHLSPFMILSFKVKENIINSIPAASHIDHTARPQSVDKETNEPYWKLINEFYKLTGVPVLLNTSFNLKGEPIVCSPYDAIRTFYTSGLDYLLIEDYLVEK